VQQVCDAFNIIIHGSEPGQILWRYTPEIYKILSSKLSIVKTLALEEILRVASDSNSLPQLLSKIDLLTLVTETIADENLGVAIHAMNILKKIGQNEEGIKLLYSGVLLRSIAKLLSLNDIVKFRVYEVIVDIAKNSEGGLSASINSGFLQSLISSLNDDDILIQLNALETLTELALTKVGLDFLEQQQVLQQLADKIARAHETPLSSLLIPGLMKFFGNVAQLCPDEIFSRYPVVISALFEVIESDDQTILAIALDTLGHVSSTVKGKYALQKLGNAMPSTLKKIAEIIKKMPSELRVRGLNNLTRIFSLNKSEQDNRILSLIKSWFDSLSDEPLKLIVSLSKQPFADIRQASLEVLHVIASQEWGQEYIANYPGLVEFLLDRNIESYKKCKEIKFEIVKNLSESVPNIFDAQTMQRFNKFINEGAFYVDTITEIAVDGV
jgi:26S proteasome non-ATPase regulatory subunit 5